MSIVELIVLLVIAAACGAIGQTLAGSSRGGLIASIVLGFIGALLGAWMARQFGLPEPFMVQIEDTEFPVLWSIIGSALFVVLLSALGGKRGGKG